MFSAVQADYRPLINRTRAEYPNFMNFIFPINNFDLSGDAVNIKSHLYDNLDPKLFQHYLDRILTPKHRRLQSDLFEKSKENDLIKRLDPRIFQKRNSTRLFKIAEVLLEKSEITNKWGYQTRDFFVTLCLHDPINHLVDIYLKVCVHRPSRAYALVVDLRFVYHIKDDNLDVTLCQLTGIVPQQYLSPVHALSAVADTSDDPYMFIRDPYVLKNLV